MLILPIVDGYSRRRFDLRSLALHNLRGRKILYNGIVQVSETEAARKQSIDWESFIHAEVLYWYGMCCSSETSVTATATVK